MATAIRWGILGAGQVARGFAAGLQALPDATLAAVASRTPASAQEFARRFGAPRVYEGVAALASDREVDVIYVATPHHRHLEDCLECLKRGKAVLCEKPFTLSAAQAREVVAAARRAGVFCMEAMWMRFIPAVQRARELIAGGAIGEVRMLSADFGVANQFDPGSRFFDRSQGGGALLDLGVYPLSLAYMLLGAPEQVESVATVGVSGVDEQSVLTLKYRGGALAIASASLRSWGANQAYIQGSHGAIQLHTPLYCPTKLTVTRRFEVAAPRPGAGGPGRNVLSRAKEHPLLRPLRAPLARAVRRLKGQSARTISLPITGNGYNYEAAEVMRCLRAGELESPLMPLDETIQIMETMDRARAEWGLYYPNEEVRAHSRV